MGTIQYVVVNKSLKMSAGKAMSQVAHAIMYSINPGDVELYLESPQRTIVVLEGTGEQIKNLYQYLDERNVTCDYVIDEGVNEIPTMSVTALATGVINIDDEDTRQYFQGFELYKHGIFQR